MGLAWGGLPRPSRAADAVSNPGASPAAAAPSARAASPVDFGRDVRPILSDRCFKCHGPDKQKAGLRLDDRAAAIAGGESETPAIVPGKPGASELLRRVTTADADERMPPSAHDGLKPEQVEVLRRWIADGAEFRPHWSFVKPVRPAVPAVRTADWPRNAIDHFVLSRLQDEGLSPSPQADRHTLARRATLDLTGLPPTVREVEAFAADESPTAYEDLVDRLLASPRYGEHWARQWLDLARYADSCGYQHDIPLPLWPYRDWVIRAFNGDMPFDRFTTEQVAGDLLPGATADQKVATAFHRCATVSLGGDADIKELRAQLTWDRVNTVGATWLGLSVGCAQCHTHKFDPTTITDYYRLYAYFDQAEDELAKLPSGRFGITGGIFELPRPADREPHVAALRQERKGVEDRLEARLQAIKSELPQRLRTILAKPPVRRLPEARAQLMQAPIKGAPDVVALRARLQSLEDQLEVAAPQTLVMADAAEPRPTHVFLRGNYQTPGEAVRPGVPAFLHAAPPDAPANRLGLAQWLVSPENPLTPRVAVNRWWAEFFGQGIVRTPDDFGLQGEPPTHPELLDWLAVEFVDRGWSMKHVHRLIVTSAAYRQSSALTPELAEKDPQNRLLARASRFRLAAETIRDNALSVSGLLRPEAGGPPAQLRPQGSSADRLGKSRPPSPEEYRRSVYLARQRGAPYASFLTFDAPDRFSCVAQRDRSNTPLQALTLLNEPMYLEAAAALAGRILGERPGGSVTDRLSWGFRLCVARDPQAGELQELEEVYRRQQARAAADPAAASALMSAYKGIGVDPAEAAAWFYVAQVLLNLDEIITKD